MHNFMFYDNISNINIPYSINRNQIIDLGHEVKNLVFYDVSINEYKNSTFNYSALDLYNTGFSLHLLSSYYNLEDLHNNNFSLKIVL